MSKVLTVQERISIVQSNLQHATQQAALFREMQAKYQGALDVLVEYANEMKAEEAKVGNTEEGLEVTGDEVDEVLATLGDLDSPSLS